MTGRGWGARATTDSIPQAGLLLADSPGQDPIPTPVSSEIHRTEDRILLTGLQRGLNELILLKHIRRC